jgi:uncharacterized protein (TIGR03437 family)
MFAPANGISISSDNGLTWRAINSGLTSLRIIALAAKGSLLFAGTEEAGVFRSLNNGQNWEPVNRGLTDPFITALAVFNDRIFLGTFAHGMFVSTDNGQSWSPVNAISNASQVSSISVVGSSIYASAGTNAYPGPPFIVSTDGGETWTGIYIGVLQGYAYFAKIGSYLFAAGGDHVYRSSDDGKTWMDASAGLNGIGIGISSIVSIGSYLYVSTWAGVFASPNNGDLWIPLSQGLADPYIDCLDVVGGNLVAGTASGTVYIHPNPFPTLLAVSAATFKTGILPTESIAALFGNNLAPISLNADTLPLPITLAGISIKAIDSTNVEEDVPLLFVSPGQINCQIPKGLAPGPVSLTLTKADGSTRFGEIYVPIANVLPGLFSANADGQGAASASIVRVNSSNVQTWESATEWDPIQNKFVPKPIDFGPSTDSLYLVLWCTGLRSVVTYPLENPLGLEAHIGQGVVYPSYAGAQGYFAGLDQVTVPLYRSAFAGAGEVDVSLSYRGPVLPNTGPFAEGSVSNTVKIRFR